MWWHLYIVSIFVNLHLLFNSIPLWPSSNFHKHYTILLIIFSSLLLCYFHSFPLLVFVLIEYSSNSQLKTLHVWVFTACNGYDFPHYHNTINNSTSSVYCLMQSRQTHFHLHCLKVLQNMTITVSRNSPTLAFFFLTDWSTDCFTILHPSFLAW